MRGQFEFVLPSPMLVWSTPLGLPGWCGGCMHQHSTNTKEEEEDTPHVDTWRNVRGCGLTSLVVCINDKFHDIRERNVTIRSEIWTTNIRSLGFRDIRECVALRGLILRSLGCTCKTTQTSSCSRPKIYIVPRWWHTWSSKGPGGVTSKLWQPPLLPLHSWREEATQRLPSSDARNDFEKEGGKISSTGTLSNACEYIKRPHRPRHPLGPPANQYA